MTMRLALGLYRVRARLAEHRDYGHALTPWLAAHLRQRHRSRTS